MKSLWNSFKIAFAMFSKIPMPQAEWTEENMRYMLCFFPFVGAAAGLLTLGVSWLGEYFGFGTGFMAMALILVPVLVTGGIHVDGLLDTSDALSSWRDREKRLEILKDSHAGAFAILICVVYFFLLYAVTDMVTVDMLPVYAMLFVVSRSLSGLSVVSFPKMKKEGTVADFSKKAETGRIRVTLICYLVLAIAGMFILNPLYGAAAIAGAFLTFGWYYRMAMKNFGGINGDLAGWFLSNCELVMPLFMVAAHLIAAKLG